ncbi:MAG TPA: hypothetical protein VF832_08385 [Longimicrobiales bacterium]
MRRPCLVVVLLLALLPASPLRAQQGVARRAAAVHATGSSHSAIVAQLAAGDTVTLQASAPVSGYVQVRTRAGTSGWVAATRLRILGASQTAAPGAVDSTWAKATPLTQPFDRGALGICPPNGRGGDSLTNHRKNRIDEPSAYHPVTLAALLAVPFPRNFRKSRKQWSAKDKAVIAPYEGVPLTVTAFVARQRGVIVEDSLASPGGESTNCQAHDSAGVDWHITLVPRPTDPKSAGVVVETTPRVRANGHPWTPAPLLAAAGAGDSVRVSGWLMYDPEHYDVTAGYDPAHPPAHAVRATLWEIHPVTKLEVFDPATKTWRTLP